MLNKLWPGFIIISFIYAVFKFNMNELNNAIFESCKSNSRNDFKFYWRYVYVEWDNGNY